MYRQLDQDIQTKRNELASVQVEVSGYKTRINWEKTDRELVTAIIDLQIAALNRRLADKQLSCRLTDEAKAFGVISMGSMIAALSKATKVIVKTPHEAVGIPTMEANAEGLRCTKQVVNMVADQTFASSQLDEEMEIIRQETRCIVDKCFELGNGDIAVGICRGVQAGVLDVPFAPCRYNAGLMLPCRDNEGAIRILNPGNLPFTKDLKDFHASKIEERAKSENRKASFQMVIDDVYAISKGRLVGRPKK